MVASVREPVGSTVWVTCFGWEEAVVLDSEPSALFGAVEGEGSRAEEVVLNEPVVVLGGVGDDRRGNGVDASKRVVSDDDTIATLRLDVIAMSVGIAFAGYQVGVFYRR